MRIFSYYYRKNHTFWFKFFGKYGLSFKNIETEGLSFSQRNGFSKFVKIGKWAVSKVKNIQV